METLWQDLRYSARMLIRKPAYTVIAVFTLAFGIGANSAIFSVVNAVLLRPLPFKNPDSVVQFWETNPLKGWTQATVAPANLFDWQKQNTSFEDIAAYMGSDTKGEGTTGFHLTTAGEPLRVEGLFVTGNLFSVLGVEAAVEVAGIGVVRRQPRTHRREEQQGDDHHRPHDRSSIGEEAVAGHGERRAKLLDFGDSESASVRLRKEATVAANSFGRSSGGQRPHSRTSNRPRSSRARPGTGCMRRA